MNEVKLKMDSLKFLVSNKYRCLTYYILKFYTSRNNSHRPYPSKAAFKLSICSYRGERTHTLSLYVTRAAGRLLLRGGLPSGPSAARASTTSLLQP